MIPFCYRFELYSSSRCPPFWCEKCFTFLDEPHNHPLKGPYRTMNPLELIKPLENDAAEAVWIL